MTRRENVPTNEGGFPFPAEGTRGGRAPILRVDAPVRPNRTSSSRVDGAGAPSSFRSRLFAHVFEDERRRSPTTGADPALQLVYW